MSKITWDEMVVALSINPAGATPQDVARLASELMQTNADLQAKEDEVDGQRRITLAYAKTLASWRRGGREKDEKLKVAEELLDKIQDLTTEGFIIEAIDVYNGDAVWDEEGLADYSKKEVGQ